MNVRNRGFSLVEVLVALLVMSIGLLGIAKMQALALSNTSGAKLRALAAIEAASLASTMQADRNYWGNVPTSLSVTVTNGAVTSSSDANLSTTVQCRKDLGGGPCTAVKMAAYDLQSWAAAFQKVMGVNSGGIATGIDAATITCAVATAAVPVSCQITVTWPEQTVNANATETAAMTQPTYTLFVDP